MRKAPARCPAPQHTQHARCLARDQEGWAQGGGKYSVDQIQGIALGCCRSLVITVEGWHPTLAGSTDCPGRRSPLSTLAPPSRLYKSTELQAHS